MKWLTPRKKINFSVVLINRLLQNAAIKKKHLVVYLLEYTRDYGITEFLTGALRTMRTFGFSSILHPRKTLLYKLNNKGAGNLLPPSFNITEENLTALSQTLSQFSYQPKISVILPVYNSDIVLLQKAIDSVKRQIYNNWEICIADDHSVSPGVLKLLDQHQNDIRIKITRLPHNSGIADASNAAIKISTGTYIALLDHDDEMAPDALYWIIKELNEFGETDILYSDECKTDKKGNLSDYFFKPDWSPELLFNMMYVGHLTIYRKDFLINKTSLFRTTYNFSQDYDLLLRASEKTTRIRHIKKVLYYWRLTKGSASQGDKPYARISNLAALQNAMERRGLPASIIELPAANRVKLNIDPKPGVSIIVPTDSFENLHDALQSIYASTIYPAFDVVVVTNSGVIQKIKTYFNHTNLLFIPYDKPYNFSDKCNHGAQKAGGEILIFFNDDVRPLQKDWIGNTIEYLFIPGVGGVSPKLIYEDDTIQYAGMTTGVRNLIGSTFHGYHKDFSGYHNYPQLVRNVSILSGACLAIKKNLFHEIGGFDAVNTPSAHSDMDISFKIMEMGLRNVYTPYAMLRHIGHLSLKEHEKKETGKKEKADIFMLKSWMKYLIEDGYFPEPMKKFLYHDSPEPFKIYGQLENTERNYAGDILVITHDLTLSGAPLNLFDLCKILKYNGYFVIVSSPSEGALKELYLQEGIPVIVDALLLSQNEQVKKFARNFDYIICNTIVVWPLVKQMQDIVPVLWWVQEAQSIENFTRNSDCAKTLGEARTVIGLSNYALSFIRKYNQNAIKIYNTCFDFYTPYETRKEKVTENRKIIISLVGAVEKRKGQDTLLEALEHLNNELPEKLEVRFIGRYQDPHFTKKIKRMARSKTFIHFTGEVTHAECLELIKETDLLVNASRDEPFSVALVEGLCAGKPCIMSEQTGIAELITEGINGFIFRHGDAADLARSIYTALTSTDQFEAIGMQARKTYENFLSVAEFEKKILHLLNAKTINPEYTSTVI